MSQKNPPIVTEVIGGRYDGMKLSVETEGYRNDGDLLRIDTHTLEEIMGSYISNRQNLPTTTTFVYESGKLYPFS